MNTTYNFKEFNNYTDTCIHHPGYPKKTVYEKTVFSGSWFIQTYFIVIKIKKDKW